MNKHCCSCSFSEPVQGKQSSQNAQLRLIINFCVSVCVKVGPTLRSQRRHVLVRASMDLVSVRVHGQHQHHDAAHDAPSDWTHRSTFDHVQRCHLLI